MVTYYDFKLHLKDGRVCYAQGIGEITDQALHSVTDSPEYQTLTKGTDIAMVEILAIGKAKSTDGIKIQISIN